MEAGDFRRWVAGASPGDVTCYHAGDLAQDRRAFPAVAALSDEAYAHADATWYRMSHCQHSRGLCKGSGEVSLFRHRREEGDGFLYFAERR